MTGKKVKLSDVTIRTSAKCEPEINDLVRWVGADHLDEGDFTVRRWSTTNDPLFPPTFKFAVRSGSVLIHSRNPKKVATLDFDAITGEKFFCLLSKNSEALHSSYLAFQLQSDRFSEYVENHFTGSVNKFLNWSALAAYEFELPSIEEQQRIVDLLSGVDAHAEALRNQLHVAKETRKSVLHHLLNAGGDDWTETTLGKVTKVIMGRQLSPSKRVGTRPRPYLRAANIGVWGININDILEMDFTEDEEANFASKPGDVLLVEGGNEKSVGCPALVTDREAGLCIQNTIIRCRVNDIRELLPAFLYHRLRFSFWRGDFGEMCTGTTIMHLGQRRAFLFPFQLPPLAEQQRIVDEILKIDSVIDETTSALAATRQLRSALLTKEIS